MSAVVRSSRSVKTLRVVASVAVMAGSSLGAAPARAGDGVWDSMLETLNLKAKPADPAPDFVERTRPDSGGLHYMQPAVPHKVSPVAVKTPAQVAAAKAALDAARDRQLNPTAPVPLDLAKQAAKPGDPIKPKDGAKPKGAAKSAAAGAD